MSTVDESTWTLDRQLLAAAVDALRVANWQRSEGKKKDYPKPIPRPGVGPSVTRIGDASHFTPAQARALIESRRPPPPIDP